MFYIKDPPLKMKVPIKIAMRMMGTNTRNHDTFLYPALHIECNTNVQNATYKNFIMNILATLDT